MQLDKMIALRLDDVGASTKRYEVYSDDIWQFGRLRVSANWLFLKYLPPFRKWGPYREMRPNEWLDIFKLLEESSAKLCVAITATWAEAEDHLVPFPQKFPDEAAVLKEGIQSGLIEIANHGLTHCVVKDNLFKPRLFASNRRYHREFWEWIPLKQHEDHLKRAQDILQECFGVEIVTFVPPGNVFTEGTLDAAARCGLHYVTCQTSPKIYDSILVIGNEHVMPFHDREIVLEGVSWLQTQLDQHEDSQFCWVKELGEHLLSKHLAQAKNPIG